ncbi:MAG: hypothetical protein M3P24_00060 [Gemmatimonadota bacterium]|nr:hypothetical protein [Gemmatimonadota bacterium]
MSEIQYNSPCADPDEEGMEDWLRASVALGQELASRDEALPTGRSCTLWAEALELYRIRTGPRRIVVQMTEGQSLTAADTIRAVYDLAELVVKNWNGLEEWQQDTLQNELERLLRRIEEQETRRTGEEAATALAQRGWKAQAPDRRALGFPIRLAPLPLAARE